jgi:hypothetical protein
MRRLRFLLLLMIMIEIPARDRAESPPPSDGAAMSSPTLPAATAASATAPPSSQKSLTAFLSREVAGEPADSFSNERPMIYLRWHGQALQAGDKISCIWIAQDVGQAAPANYHVDEASFIAGGPHASGTFTLSKPKPGWPEGKYRVEIYIGAELVETLPFTIEKLRGD